MPLHDAVMWRKLGARVCFIVLVAWVGFAWFSVLQPSPQPPPRTSAVEPQPRHDGEPVGPFVEEAALERASCPSLENPSYQKYDWMSDDALVAAGWPARLKKLDKLRGGSPLAVGNILRPSESLVSPRLTSRGTLVGMRAGVHYWLARVDASPGHRVLAFREDVTGFPQIFGELGNGFFSADVTSEGTLRKLDDALHVVAERQRISPGAMLQVFDPDGQGGVHMLATASNERVEVAHIGANLQDLAPPRSFRVPEGSDIRLVPRRIGHGSDRHCFEFHCSHGMPRTQANTCPHRYLLLDANLEPLFASPAMTPEIPPKSPPAEASLAATPQTIAVRVAAALTLLVLGIIGIFWMRWRRRAREIAFGALEGVIVQEGGTDVSIRSAARIFTLSRKHTRFIGFAQRTPLQGPCVLTSRFSGKTAEDASDPYRGGAFAFAPGAPVRVFPGEKASAREFVRERAAALMRLAAALVVVLTTTVWLICQLSERY